MSSKQDIIGKIYFDRSGYGSKQTTLRDAKEKDKTITMKDVEEFFRKNVEQKKQLRGQNSFIPPHPFYEFQMDLFFINDLEEQKFRVGLLMIDIFTKYMVVVPILSKGEGDIASGMMEALKKMNGKPELLYTDDETALNTQAIQDYLKEQGIAHHRTRGHPNFSERAIRTYKDMLYKRVEADEKKGKENIQWIDYNLEILLTYNDKMIHSSIKMTPKQATKQKDNLKAKVNMTLQATKTRRYPEISTGDKVKIYRKKAITEKERSSNWGKETYTVERIEKKLGQSYFYLEGLTRGYLRNEILKV